MTRDEALRTLTAEGQPYALAEIIALGRPVRAFVNAPASLRDLFDENRSDLPFIVFGEERLTFEEVWRRSAALAAALARDYGVVKGDRVVIAMRNYPEWVVAFNAAVYIGAIAVPMNALWQAQEMAFALEDCRPKVVVVDQERLGRVSAYASSPGAHALAVRTGNGLPPGAHDFETVLACVGEAAAPRPDLLPDDDAIMLYTSGSTGRPKGVVSTHRNIISALLSWELDAEARMACGRLARAAPDAPQGAMLLAVPLFHVAGLHVSLLQSYRAQRRLVCMYKWNAEQAADLIERERISGLNGPAAITGDLLEVARRSGRDMSSLVSVGGGGAARAPEQVRTIDAVFTNAEPNTGWGMTETNAIGVSNYGEDYVSHPSSSGQVSAVLDIRIVDEAGRPLPVLAQGELQVRGASIMRGYWNNPQATDEAFVGGWLRTGDVGYVDAEGFVYIVDRLKDLVIRGGENIGCGGVEAALLEHPDILEVSVYGVPDARLGEEVGATLYARRRLAEGELQAFLAPRLAGFEIPRHVHYSATPLPRTASGKVLKRQLKAEAAERLGLEPGR